MRVSVSKMILFYLLIILFSCGLESHVSKAEDTELNLWLVIKARDYYTCSSIFNLTVSAILRTNIQVVNVKPMQTNGTGEIQYLLGRFKKASLPKEIRLEELTFSDNLTLVRINSIFLEDLNYEAEALGNSVSYRKIGINLDINVFEEYAQTEINLWFLRGKIVAISDMDPITGKKTTLQVKPSIKVSTKPLIQIGKDNRTSFFESYYLMPLNYSVTISQPKSAYPPLKVKIDENTTFINWSHYAAEKYAGDLLLSLEQEIGWLKSFGLTLSFETKEYEALKSLFKRSLSLYSDREYEVAFSGLKTSLSRLESFKKWFSDIRSFALLTAISVSLFSYIFASLLSSIIFEEPGKEKYQLILKITLFFLLPLAFSIADPSSRIGYAIFVEGIANVPVLKMSTEIIIVGLLISSAAIYFFMTLISIKRTAITGLALSIGVRSLKRRVSRTVLTLITIIIIVSSSITFVNVSAARETKIKGSWIGTELSGILLDLEKEMVKLNEEDIKWIQRQEWCKNMTLIMKVIPENIYDPILGNCFLVRLSSLIGRSGEKIFVNIVCLDPDFMASHYNFSKYIRGAYEDFTSGKKVVILPSSLNIVIGDYVAINVSEQLQIPGATMPLDLGTKNLGSFKVVGTFDPIELSELKRLDGAQLFKDVDKTILIPMDAVDYDGLITAEIIVIPKDEYNPVDVARDLTYMFGFPVIANKEGLSTLVAWSMEISVEGFIPFLIPLTVAGLIMYLSMTSIYEERKRELSVLATLGLDPDNTSKVFLSETLILGLLGTLIGFFGSYLASALISSISSLLGNPLVAPLFREWSIFTVFIALFTGVVMAFLGGYIPIKKVRSLSLMGRAKVRELSGELIYIDAKTLSFDLPIRETVQNSEFLFNYIKDAFTQIRPRIIDQHTVKGELRADGSFEVLCSVIGLRREVLIPCRLKGERSGDIIRLSIDFPAEFKDYSGIRNVLRALESKLIEYPSWRDMQMKMKIVREAPKREKTMDEVLEEIRKIMEQIKDVSKKLKLLEAQRGKLSEEIFEEFRRKYSDFLREKIKDFRSAAIGLESYFNQIQGEIRKINVEIERVTVAYSLGEISEEEYIKTCSPLQNRLTALKSRLKEVEEILDFLKKPLGLEAF